MSVREGTRWFGYISVAFAALVGLGALSFTVLELVDGGWGGLSEFGGVTLVFAWPTILALIFMIAGPLVALRWGRAGRSRHWRSGRERRSSWCSWCSKPSSGRHFGNVPSWSSLGPWLWSWSGVRPRLQAWSTVRWAPGARNDGSLVRQLCFCRRLVCLHGITAGLGTRRTRS